MERSIRIINAISKRARVMYLVAASLPLCARSLPAQLPVNDQLTVGADIAEYVRFAQTMGLIPLYPWSIRDFSNTVASSLLRMSGAHPWSARPEFSATSSDRHLTGYAPSVSFSFNSAFPFGDNDGPVWAGKGLTTVIKGGVSARYGPISLDLAPVFFRAENSSFALLGNGESGRLQYGDGQFSETIDRPQRFGTSAYQRLDPGQSTLQIEAYRMAVGVSTATQSWGPSDQYQFILGNNAPGYAHVFAGTGEPVNLFLATVQTRVVWGSLEQSDFSPVSGPKYFVDAVQSGTRRFSSGIIVTIQPRGAPGLEIGAARFFHSPWPKDGLRRSDFAQIFQNFFKKLLPTEAPLPGNENTQGIRDNQLSSVFMRWAVPGSGFEAYGEFGRDDHSFDIRDFWQEPDHGGASRMLGIRRMWQSGYALRAEAINFEEPQIARKRGEGSVYLHSVLRQGHTNRGQLLGADVGVGSGAGSTIAVDRYTSNGSTTWEWTRSIGHERGIYYLTGTELPRDKDVLHTLSFERLDFRGRVDVRTKVSLTADLNRNFQSDVYNVNVQAGTSFRF